MGRAREVAAITEQLTTTRLLTLTGPGGIGKTRLAVRAASQVRDRFPEGTWLVDLATAAGADVPPRAVAAALGIREHPERPLVETLAAWLAPQRLLLILDNCEHVVASCARLSETLLHACPEVQILATSREPLRAEGELVWRVPSLAVPEAGHRMGVGEVAQVESVALFLERARARRPDFVLTAERASAVAEICRRLEGIPLAIELAAARLSVLTVDQIAARLDDALRLLAGGRRTAPRQETMRAALDWSYELLDEAEQVVFRRMAVFSGGFDLRAVEAICAGAVEGASSIHPGDVLALLGALVEKSLVVAWAHGAEARYRLLEPVRQYADERLTASGEMEAVRWRYAQYYVDLTEDAEPHLRSGRRPPFMARLATELDNLRAALAWARNAALAGDVRGADLALRLSGALFWFWYLHGHVPEGRRWVEAALSAGADAAPAARARALFTAGTIAWLLDDAATARRWLDEAVALCRWLDDRRQLPYALTVLANVVALQGDESASASLDREARTLFQEGDDPWGLAVATYAAGLRALFRDDLVTAAEQFEAALQRFRRLQDAYYIANTLGNLGDIARERGEDARAELLYQEGLDLLRTEREEAGVPSLLHNLGHVALRRHDPVRAASLFREALAIFHQQGDQRGRAECLIGLAGVSASLGRPELAAQLFGAGQAMLDAAGAAIWPSNRVDYERNLAAVRAQLDEPAFARSWAVGAAMPPAEVIALASQELLSPGQPPLLVPPAAPLPAEVRRLTAREREVAALVAQGLTNRAIADRLVITEGTAALHVKHILAKLDFASRAQIAAWAVEHGLVPSARGRRTE